MQGVHPSRRPVVARHAAVFVVASVLAASTCAAAPSRSVPSDLSVPSDPSDPSDPAPLASAPLPSVPLPPAPPSLRTAIDAAWRAHPGQRAVEAGLAASRARLRAAERPLHNPELEVARDDGGAETTTSIGLRMALDLADKRGARQIGRAHV